MKQIITLTLNPALDRTIYIDKIEIGKTIRANKVYEEIGGKGLNVSKALNDLGQSSISLGLVGTNLRAYIETFKSKYNLVQNDFIETKKLTRICSDYISKNGLDFKVNEKGYLLNNQFQKKILKQVQKTLKDNQIWVLSGSLPNGFDEDFYCQIIDLIQTTNSKFIIDTSGMALSKALDKKPFLIKPNLHECEEILGINIKSLKDCKNAVQLLVDKGIQNVALSLGAKGLVYGSEKQIIHFKPPKVSVKKTTGAGDGLVAALIFGIINNFKIKKIGKFAVTFASLSTTFETVEYPSYNDTIKYLDKSSEI